METETINVSEIEPRKKHPFIFERFDATGEGNSIIIDNDHDPKPLYYQMLAERGPVFSWEYLENGPERWKVRITRASNMPQETVGEMVSRDFRKAQVFKKFGIDFCCGGKKTLEEACQKKGLDVLQVKQELEDAGKSSMPTGADFEKMPLSDLCDYIVSKHHTYVNANLQILDEFVSKVARVHGDRHPEMVRVAELYRLITADLQSHMMKEERILFPFIKSLDAAARVKAEPEESHFGTVQNPIRMMEHEHEQVGGWMEEISRLTDTYIIPSDACTTYRVSLLKLKEFEEDLHVHIHLENNILFPRAVNLEYELSK